MSLAKQGWEKLRADLDWRGPNGNPQRYAVIPRELAEAMLAERNEMERRT